MTELLTRADFAQHLGQTFTVWLGEGTGYDLALIEVKALGQTPPAGVPARAEPFSVIFRSGERDRHLPQRTYRLTAAGLAPLEIFLVPIGPDAAGMRYEAIFT